MKWALSIIVLIVSTSLFANESVEELNKERVRYFFENYPQSAAAVVHPQVKWWVPESLPFGKTYESAAEYFGMLEREFVGFATPLRFKIVGEVLASGNEVAVEIESNALHYCSVNRIPFNYNNRYHFKISMSDGKFVAVREYNDTKHLLELYNLIRQPRCQYILSRIRLMGGR